MVVKPVAGGHDKDGNAWKIYTEWVKQYCSNKGANLVLLEGINNSRETFLAISNHKSKMVKACMLLSTNPTKAKELMRILVVSNMT